MPGNLKAMRGELSQAEFASLIGIPNQVTYHRYESGRVPKAEMLQQIAARLGITVDELLSPMTGDRATSISIRAIVNAKDPARESSAKSFCEDCAELVSAKSVKSISEAMQLGQASDDELSKLFGHIVQVSNRAPAKLMKYYVLVRVAIGRELERRLIKK